MENNTNQITDKVLFIVESKWGTSVKIIPIPIYWFPMFPMFTIESMEGKRSRSRRNRSTTRLNRQDGG